ncbi:MAG: hypothetical protein GXO91_05905 [FCB group bacterium]|nr:hypothetical protein [FCB group bacterium]
MTVHTGTPIIIIPGIMGTQLVDPVTGNMVWGKMINLRAVDPHRALLDTALDGLELPTDRHPITANRDRLVPKSILTEFEIINRIGEVKVYRDLVNAFSRCGLKPGDIERCRQQENVYLFPYDWRRDLVETAQLLAERIRQIQQVSENPRQKVTIIAHSMGGVIAKYYLLYGDQDVISDFKADELPEPTYAGAGNVSRIFYLGTPHDGSMNALKSLNEGEFIMPFVTVSKWATFTMPSLYELIPLPQYQSFMTERGKPVELNLFRLGAWEANGFSIFSSSDWKYFQRECSLLYPHDGDERSQRLLLEFESFIGAALDRGFRFQTALQQLDQARLSTEQYIIAGTGEPTLSAGRVKGNPSKNGEGIRFVDHKFIRESYYFNTDGDGTVSLDQQLRHLPPEGHFLTGPYLHKNIPSYPEVQQFIIDHLAP